MFDKWQSLTRNLSGFTFPGKAHESPRAFFSAPARERRAIYVQRLITEGYETMESRNWERVFPKSRHWFTENITESFLVKDFAASFFFEFHQVQLAISDRTCFADLTERLTVLSATGPGVNLWLLVEPFSQLNSPAFLQLLSCLEINIREGRCTLVVYDSSSKNDEQIDVRTFLGEDQLH